MKGLEFNETNNNEAMKEEACKNYLDVEKSFYEFLNEAKTNESCNDDFSSMFMYL